MLSDGSHRRDEVERVTPEQRKQELIRFFSVVRGTLTIQDARRVEVMRIWHSSMYPGDRGVTQMRLRIDGAPAIKVRCDEDGFLTVAGTL